MKRPVSAFGVLVALLATFALGATAASAADDCSNAELRGLQGSAYLPDCRAFELVSPADKNGGSVLWGAGGLPTGGMFLASADGEKVVYSSYQPFPQSKNGVGTQPYLSSRTGAGWETIAMGSTTLSPNPSTFDRVNAYDSTDDFSTFLMDTSAVLSPLDQDAQEIFPGFTLFYQDTYKQSVGAPPELVSRASDDVPATGPFTASYAGRSDDASKVLFQTGEPLTPEADPIPPFARYLYVREANGTTLVNVDEGGAMIGECGATLGDNWLAGKGATNAVSSDGQRIFFRVPDEEPRVAAGGGPLPPGCEVPPQVYMRDGDAVMNVSASQMETPDPIVAGAVFEAATGDGSRVFFTSGDRLTDDATPGGGLYAYDVDSEVLSFLSTGATGPGGAEVDGVVRSTDDGSHVYFIAKGQLDGSKGVAGGENLYLWTPGSVRFVTTLAAADVQEVGGEGLTGVAELREARITSDGSTLLILSRADLTDYEAEGTVQAYLWDEDGEMVCVSCDPSGDPPTGKATLRSKRGSAFGAEYQHDSRNLLDDGRVFFETTAALVKRDVNGTLDVYTYVPGGAAQLLTDGKAKYGSSFFDASADGRDVLVATQASLVPQDIDNGENDIYDVRLGGGFHPPAQSSCAGEACQGDPSSQPAAAEVGSATVNVPGSKDGGRRLLSSVSGRVDGYSVTVRARVAEAGVLSASGPGLSRARKSVKKGGAYKLKLSLERAAKKRLLAKGQLEIRIKVRFAPAEGSAVTRTTIARFRCGKKCTNADGRVQG